VRFAITFEVPVEAGNAFEKNPKAAERIFQLLEQAKPEAIYAGVTRRFMILVVKAESHEELMKLMTPIWHTMKVYPQVDIVMKVEEFKAAFQSASELLKGL